MRRSKSRPVDDLEVEGFAGECGVWSVAEDAILPAARWDWGEAGGLGSRSGVGRVTFSTALLEPVTVAVHLQDVPAAALLHGKRSVLAVALDGLSV